MVVFASLGFFVVGFLATLLLACHTETSLQFRTHQGLKTLGFDPHSLFFRAGWGLALCGKRQRFCVINEKGGQLQFQIIPWDDVLAVDFRRKNASEQRYVRKHIAIQKAVERYLQDHKQTETPSRKTVAMSILTRVPGFGLTQFMFENEKEFRHWKGVAQEWHNSVIQGNENRSVVPSSKVQQTPVKSSRPAQDNTLLAQLQERLHDLFNVQLKEAQRIIVAEKQLRDSSGVDMPIIHFHECLNRLKRKKALSPYRLAYSRQDETWRVSRRA